MVKQKLVGVVLGVGLLGSTALAFYFGQRAGAYEEALAEVQARVAEQVPAAAAADPVVAVRPAPVVLAAESNRPMIATTVATNDAVMALRGRVGELELLLQRSEDTVRRLQGEAQRQRNEQANRPPEGPRSPEQWMEALRQSDPERYAAMQAEQQQREVARQEARERLKESLDEKSTFLNEVEAEAATGVEKAAYRRMIGLLAESYALTEKMRSDLPRGERREIMHTLREKMTVLEPMLETERQKEWLRLGAELGYDAAGAEKFAAYLSEVVDVTSMENVYDDMRSGAFGRSHWGRQAITSDVPAGAAGR